MGGVHVQPIAPPAPTFAGANESYLKSLTASGVTGASMEALKSNAGPVDVGPEFEAMKSSMTHGIDEGRADLIEKFGVQGLRYGTDMDKAGADFESQTQTNFANILAQFTEAAKKRQVEAATVGAGLSETAGLAVSPTQVAGGPTTGQTAASVGIQAAQIAATIAMFA